MEANLRFGVTETMETRVFARLSAWQNWIFIRPNAVGETGALKVFGTGSKAKFNWEGVVVRGYSRRARRGSQARKGASPRKRPGRRSVNGALIGGTEPGASDSTTLDSRLRGNDGKAWSMQ